MFKNHPAYHNASSETMAAINYASMRSFILDVKNSGSGSKLIRGAALSPQKIMVKDIRSSSSEEILDMNSFSAFIRNAGNGAVRVVNASSESFKNDLEAAIRSLTNDPNHKLVGIDNAKELSSVIALNDSNQKSAVDSPKMR